MKFDMLSVREHMLEVRGKTEQLVLLTPTGPAREALTESAIHLTAAIDHLDKSGKAFGQFRAFKERAHG